MDSILNYGMVKNGPGERESAPSTTVQSVQTTFRVIESLQKLGEAGVTELAMDTGLAKSTVHKHLATLREESYVTAEENTYRLGARFLDLGGFVRESHYGGGRIKHRIRSLAEETGQVAHFAVPEHGRAVVLYRESGQEDVPTRSRIGKRMHLHQTSYGKAILAHLPDHRADAILDRPELPTATEHTITNPATLREELVDIRDSGYAINDKESTKGLRAIGAPILLDDGSVFGGCSIAGPEMRIDDDKIDDLLRITKQLELEIKYA